MTDEKHHSPERDESLDALLRRSGRTEVDSRRVDRLDAQWSDISRRRANSQAGLAAIVVVTVGVGFLLAIQPAYDGLRDAWNEEPLIARQGTTATVEEESPSPSRHEQSASSDEPRRSAFDLLICVAVERKSRQKEHQPVDVETREPEVIAPILSAIRARIDAEKEQGIEDLVERFQRESSELELLRWIEKSDDPSLVEAALELLGHVSSERSLPLLTRLSVNPRLHAACTRIMSQHADSRALFQLAKQESDPALCRELAASLLRKQEDAALLWFLRLVDDRTTSQMALAAVDDVDDLPMETLFACLSAPSRQIRLTAAMVLGRSGDPEVSSRLVHLLPGSRTRRAAMVALVASDDDAARRFVDHARRDVYLAATVNAAQSVVSSFRMEG